MSTNKTSFKAKWEAMPAKRRQQIALLAVMGGVGLISFVMLTGSGAGTRQEDPTKLDAKVTNTLLPDENTRDIGMSGLANDVEAQRDENEGLKERVGRIEELQKQQEKAQQEGGANRSRDEQMRAEMEEIRNQMDALKTNGVPQAAPAQGQQIAAPVAEAPAAYGGIRNIGNTGASAGGPGAATDAEFDSQGGGSGGSAGEEKSEEPESGQLSQAKVAPKMYLPSGSIIQGVMLTGLDAPTGKGALKDPVPVLVRIQKEAILPNHFRADVKECFALVAGQGDLASERAYLRSESISCVRKDKGVIDLSMRAYVVDTDGKAGLRGRLVSKQGSVLSKAILASFADGVSQAFKGNTQPIKLGDDANVDYGNAAYAGGIMGASSSLDRISKYYLDLADQLFPILEIDAGREVTLVLVKGMEMTSVR